MQTQVVATDGEGLSKFPSSQLHYRDVSERFEVAGMTCRYCQTAIDTVEDIVQLLNTFITLHSQLQAINHRRRVCEIKSEFIESIMIMFKTLTELYRELNLGSLSIDELVDPLL